MARSQAGCGQGLLPLFKRLAVRQVVDKASSLYLRESDQNMVLKTARLEPTVTSCNQVRRYLYLEILDQKQGRHSVAIPRKGLGL